MSNYLKGQLFAHQPKLQFLPVPTLEETCDRFLKSCLPLAKSSEEFTALNHKVQALKDGLGPKLQQRLLARYEAEREKGKSWLIDWWNDYAYMSYRDPVVVWVNYFFAFCDDKRRMNPSERAASIVQGALSFKDLVVSGDLPPEATKSGPLCSEQYKYLFNATRIPTIPSDTTKLSDPAMNHIIVIRRNQFFVMDLEPNGKRLSTEDIKNQFDKIYAMAGNLDLPVGALTTENRDIWTIEREELLKSRVNKETLDIIESAAFVVCLDESRPVTKEEHSIECWHGDGRNRFFDKSMQFIIFDNGKAGFNGEHSNMEATITHRCCDWVLENLSKGKIDHGVPSSLPIEPPKKLQFDLSPKSVSAIKAATVQFDALVAKHDLQVVTFEGYGKSLIKKFSVSPDAFAQMAIQLAYYKMYGFSGATYESAGTRKFIHGRTETGRSVSVETVAWVKAMENVDMSVEEKGKLGRQAIASQSAYMHAAGDGHGVDRHFLGLKMLIQNGEETPALFSDPLFKRSSHWNLSTSQVTSEFYDGYGWGEVVSDGYGVAYMVKNNSLQFNIVSQKLNNHHLKTYFHEALNEMRPVFEATIPPPKSKFEMIDTLENIKNPQRIKKLTIRGVPGIVGLPDLPEKSESSIDIQTGPSETHQNIPIVSITVSPDVEHPYDLGLGVPKFRFGSSRTRSSSTSSFNDFHSFLN